jgi:DNA-binding CsgD family transcriptional regulator
MRTREELEALLELVRGWSHPPARIHGLATVAGSFIYWPGELRRAAAVAAELLAASEEYGSAVGQAHALVLLAELHMAFGEFDTARGIERRAAALAARVGPDHRIRRLVDNAGEIGYVLAGGDWADLAERYGAIGSDASLAWGTGQLGAGALAVYALAQLGRREEVEGLIEDFTPALRMSRPTDLAHGGCVCNIAGAIWDLELRGWANTYRQLALELLDAGLGDLSGHSQDLAVARMAGLEGDLDAAFVYFARARAVLDRSGQRPLRAIVDHEEAVLRARHGLPGVEALAVAARDEFARMGMTMWLERADGLAATLASRPPAGLSRRELDVLRLVGAGRTNKEIAGELVISVRTVERHVLNAYAKIGARRRADAIAYALQHGL